MRVFLTGATGYIGASVLEAVLRAGHDVTTLVRGGAGAEHLRSRGANLVKGDLGHPEAWRGAAEGFEAYIHTGFETSPRGADVDRKAIEAMATLARAARSALIYTSGVWVLGNTPTPATEATPVNPTALSAWRPDHERIALSAAGDGARPIVVRPGTVYGGGRGIITDLLKEADNGLMRVIGQGRNHWANVYERDLGDLYARLLGSREASGIYHANDEADETVDEIVQAIAAHAATRPDVRFVPLEEARRKLGSYADALALDQIVRSPRARALGWHPTIGSVARNVPRLFEEWRNARAAAAR
jgi:nucleoside-diphosphate-sugar epimerase